MNQVLDTTTNYDILYHSIQIGSKQGCYYFIDGFCKDDIMQKITQFFMEMQESDTPKDAYNFLKKFLPYPEIGKGKEIQDIEKQILSGVIVLFVDVFDYAVYIDARTYPARGITEPDKEKTLCGSKDGFVETIVFNTALLRRRIRSSDLKIEMFQAGKSSKTDIAVCYMKKRVNTAFLNQLKSKISEITIDALTVNQESLAECLYRQKWFNPFPKLRYTERPDIASAQVMEGNIVIFTDNSPFAMVLPTSLFDIMEEADDYYFPPLTGTYLRLSRMLIGIVSFLITPTFLLFMLHPGWIPDSFAFVKIKETVNIPIFFQFLILELAIDGLRLAAVNTPSMLSTPLSIMAALVLGEFSVNSGWFNAEVMLYMAFVAIANYTQTSYELGYAIKFLRILTLILTSIFSLPGYIAGIMIFILLLAFNKTVSGTPYLAPLLPFQPKKLYHRLFRKQL